MHPSNNGSIRYSSGVSSCDIAGAVALCAIHDLEVNYFSYAGFPHIQVDDEKDRHFRVTLTVFREERIDVSFVITREEAFAAAKQFRAKKGYHTGIFDRVQDALSKTVG